MTLIKACNKDKFLNVGCISLQELVFRLIINVNTFQIKSRSILKVITCLNDATTRCPIRLHL